MKLIVIVVALTVESFLAQAQLKVRHNDTIHLSPDVPYPDDDFTGPSFPGGLKRFEAYLKKNIRYPENAIKNNIKGKVYLVFAIEKDGSIGDIKVLKGVSEELDNEAVRVLKSSPKWVPGTHHGSSDVVYQSIPIYFQLPPQTQKIDTADNKIYTAVEQEPEFPGGTVELTKYLTKTPIAYDENEDIQGDFLFEMVIEKDGRVSDVKELRKIPNSSAGKAFIKRLKSSPKWKPGVQKGKPVRVKYFLPLHF